MKTRVVPFLLTMLMIFAFQLNAQIANDTTDHAPKIGLVLSGGGAKGMAHIGVLKVLEEVGLYPDVITGTSMGSVVGGLYAMGYTADELETIATTSDWIQLLSNTIAFEDIAIEEKPYYGRFFAELPIIGISPTLPRGLIEGQNLHNLLSTLTRNAHDIESFDDLPIPFRCVATNIATGERVVLKDGSLSEAIRASMAIPAVFSPIEIDSMLLVDGGLVRNFPVQEAIDMGADYIIGVFVSSDLSDKENLRTLTDIFMQASFVMSVYDSREEVKLVDLYVAPVLDDYNSGSFSNDRAIIQQGLDKGKEMKNQFIALRDSLQQLGKVFRKPRPLDGTDNYLITQIDIDGNHKISDDYIRGKMEFNLPEEVTIQQIEKQIRYTYGTGYFSKITFSLTHNSSGHTLTLHIQEKPSDVYAKAALHYNNEIRAGINLNFTLRNKLGKNTRTIAEIDFSENFSMNFSYLKYLGEGKRSAATLGYYYLNNKVPYYDQGFRISEFKNRRSDYYAKWQSTDSNKGTFGVRFNFINNKLSPSTSDLSEIIEHIKQSSATVTAFWEHNTLNQRFFPTKGMRLQAGIAYSFDANSELKLNLADSLMIDESLFEINDFFSTTISLDYYYPVLPKLTLVSRLYLRYLSEDRVGFTNEMGLGGFYENYEFTLPFWGAEYYQFSITDIGMAQVGFQYEFKRLFFAQILVNYANEQIQNIWEDAPEDLNFGDNDYLLGGGIGIGYRSLLGPILLNLGKSNASDELIAGINIGFWF